jgi:predicted deacetylase
MLALRKAGFHYTTRWDAVDLLQPPDRPVATIAAPTLVWSVRARWRRVCSRAWIRMWGIAQSRAEVLRIAVHPVDFAHPKVEASVRAAIARHLADRTTARYCDLLPAGAQPMGCVR